MTRHRLAPRNWLSGHSRDRRAPAVLRLKKQIEERKERDAELVQTYRERKAQQIRQYLEGQRVAGLAAAQNAAGKVADRAGTPTRGAAEGQAATDAVGDAEHTASFDRRLAELRQRLGREN